MHTIAFILFGTLLCLGGFFLIATDILANVLFGAPALVSGTLLIAAGCVRMPRMERLGERPPPYRRARELLQGFLPVLVVHAACPVLFFEGGISGMIAVYPVILACCVWSYDSSRDAASTLAGLLGRAPNRPFRWSMWFVQLAGILAFFALLKLAIDWLIRHDMIAGGFLS